MNTPDHIKEHALLGMPPWFGDIINSNLRGFCIIDMNNDDYVMPLEHAKCAVWLFINTGDGTKTVTIPHSDFVTRDITVLVAGNPIAISDGVSPGCAAFFISRILYVKDVATACVDNESVCIAESTEFTSAANTNEQILKQLVLPIGSLSDGNNVMSSFIVEKSGASTTETLKIRIGSTGTTSDSVAWSNNTALTGSNISVAAQVMLVRSSETVFINSNQSSLSPFSASTSAISQITVPDTDINNLYITLTGTNSTGAETVTVKSWTVRIQR